MSYLIICPLAEIETVAHQHQPQHMISLVEASTQVPRPPMIPPKQHLFLAMNDIRAPQMGLVAPLPTHVETLLDFAKKWQQHPANRPLLVHCWMGISRSTAAAFIIACALQPKRDEQDIAHELRLAAPFATPNSRLVALADDLLARQDRMNTAISQIGRGAFTSIGQPFLLELGSISSAK